MSVRVSLSEFREELHRQGLNAFLVPMDDAHMGEYSPSSERRITALSGFLGSAGSARVSSWALLAAPGTVPGRSKQLLGSSWQGSVRRFTSELIRLI